MSNANQASFTVSVISRSRLRSSKNQVSSSQPKSSGQPQQQPSSRASSSGKLASTLSAHPTVSSGTCDAETPQAGPVKKVNYTVRALDCINCGTSRTLLWKRHDVGNNVCNACG
ncbi:hypothetical protein K503DRAFT_774971, partial [Rhizopogon vinicolor AM-OR11-026]